MDAPTNGLLCSKFKIYPDYINKYVHIALKVKLELPGDTSLKSNQFIS